MNLLGAHLLLVFGCTVFMMAFEALDGDGVAVLWRQCLLLWLRQGISKSGGLCCGMCWLCVKKFASSESFSYIWSDGVFKGKVRVHLI